MNKRNRVRTGAALMVLSLLLAGIPMQVYAEQQDETAVTEETAAEPETDPAGEETTAEDETAETTETSETTEETTTDTTESTTSTERTTMTAPDALTMIQSEETPDGGIRILSFKWTTEENVTIPDTIGGKPVTEIAEGAFKYCYSDTVALPDTVRVIGAHAFEGCAYLQQMEIPQSCESIGAYAFADCTRLAAVSIPDSVQEIGRMAFDNTAFYSSKTEDAVILGDGILYAYNGDAASLTIPDNVKCIAAYACAEHESLRSVTIPAGVKRIQECAFGGCTALAEIQTPDYIPELAADAFTGTKWYSSGKEEFLTLGKMLIAYRGKENVIEVPDGIRVINDSAFEANKSVTTVKLPESVEEIRRAAFYGCPSLQVAEFGDRLNTIGDMAFWGCETLSYLRLGHGLATVGDYAFAGCPRLEKVYLPDTLQSIGNKAFGYSYDDAKGYLRLKNELVLYSNSAVGRAYAEAEGITHEPLPDEENTAPTPVVTAPPDEAALIGTPRGKAWLAAGGIGIVLIAAGLIRRLIRKRRETD